MAKKKKAPNWLVMILIAAAFLYFASLQGQNQATSDFYDDYHTYTNPYGCNDVSTPIGAQQARDSAYADCSNYASSQVGCTICSSGYTTYIEGCVCYFDYGPGDLCDLISSNWDYTCTESTQGQCSSGTAQGVPVGEVVYCAEGSLLVLDYGTPSEEYWCYVSGSAINTSFTTCPNGCSNGVCQEQVCLPNAEWCDGSIVKSCSSDGMTILIDDTCNSQETCYEQTSQSAYCKSNTIYYCPQTCIGYGTSSTCYTSGNYYTDSQTCQDNIVYYCLSADKKSCQQRLGTCGVGELEFYSEPDTNSALSSCEAQIVGGGSGGVGGNQTGNGGGGGQTTTSCLESTDCATTGKCVSEQGGCVSACTPFLEKWVKSDFVEGDAESGCGINISILILLIGGIMLIKFSQKR